MYDKCVFPGCSPEPTGWFAPWSEHGLFSHKKGWSPSIFTLSEELICPWWGIPTSSTAQGGGGSFKNRKPIGEIGCCESRMPEQSHWWTDRLLRSPLFLSLSFSFSDYLPTYLSIYLSIYLANLSIYLSIYLPTYLSIYLSVYLSICKLENEAILRDVLRFWTWQHQKRSNSARLPQCLNLTTSKTKQVCETSSFFEVDNIKNERILRDFLQKWKVACRADGLVPMRFAISPVQLSKLLRLPRKSDARSYEVLHLSRKIISANLKIWCSKMQPLSGNHRPDLLTALMKMSLVLRLSRKMHLCRSSSNVPRPPSFLEMLQNPHVLPTFEKVHNPLPLPRESTSEPPKVARTCGVLCILTSKCASRHNGVHFFDISTSKSGPDLVCFVHFELEMCFAPQRRALFRHLNFQKWSDNGVFCAFWLQNVLRATTACTFSTSQLPKVVREWCVLYILISKCASRHNGVHFFDISTSKSGPRMVCFVHFDFETCFAPQRHAIFHFSSGEMAPHPPL